MNALCCYAAQNDIDSQGLVDMCKLSAKDLSEQHKKAWCKIAECLPNRTVQSIHNVCKRRFNPDNYSGEWTQQEQQALVELVQTLGH